MKFNPFLFLIFLMGFLQSCMSEMKPALDTKAVAVTSTGYTGCIAATALTTNSIKIDFSFPSTALEISVYRDGLPILTTKNQFNTSFVDINLIEGEDYHYECVALINDKYMKGDKALDSTTLIAHAPVFTGIESITALSPTSVRVKWPITDGGSVAKEFKIFSGINASVDFTKTARVSVKAIAGVYTADVTALADDMPYKFAVRACTSTGICDTNTKELAITMADNGAAKTLGATSAIIYNGVTQITAPWSEDLGAIAKRRVYRSTTNNVSTILSTLIKTVNVSIVSNLANPPTMIEDNSIASEGVTYYYIVRDEDPSGNITASSNIVSVTVGDLTPPNFNGLTNVALGVLPTNSPETNAVLTWTAITNQPIDTSGTTYYLIYRTEATPPATPANACSAGVLVSTLNSSNYTPTATATYVASGLSARKTYSFCMKAQDAALNISNTPTTSAFEITMGDVTPPVFDGLQGVTYDVSNNRFNLAWDPSSSSDIFQYRLKIWKNQAVPTTAPITTMFFLSSSYPSSATFNSTNFNYSDGDTVYMMVDACDNASPTYNSTNNCTSLSYSSALSKNLLDTTPPPGFLGVTTTSSLTQGIIQVNWTLPTDKSDYAGFKIYDIVQTGAGTYSKVFLASTYCTSNNCATNPLTTYNYATTHYRRDYNIFVSAVDLLGNETKATDAANTLSFSSVTSLDSTKPTYSTQLTSLVSGGNVNLAWLATDNQDANKNYNTVNTLKYDVYRKTGVTGFNTATYVAGVPVIDANTIKLASDLTATTYADPTNVLIEGQTYHYTVCAKDSSSNVQCSDPKTELIRDTVAPVITYATIAEAVNSASWNLKIKVNDGSFNLPSTVTVTVYAKYTVDPNDFPTGSGSQLSAPMTGTGTTGTPTEFTFYTGTVAADPSFTSSSPAEYVNLFIRATDSAVPSGNVTEITLSHMLKQAPPAPTTLTMIGDSAVTVDGVRSGDSIKLFSNSSCTGTALVSGVASSTSINLNLPALSAGSYTFYANATNSITNTSSCSVAFTSTTIMPPWSTQMGVAAKNAFLRAITTDTNNNVYGAGSTDGNLDGVALIGTNDGFIIKYTSSGTKLWTKLIGVSTKVTNIYKIKTDGLGNIYAVGNTNGSLPGSNGLQSSQQGSNSFVIKLDSSGNTLWTRQLPISWGTALTLDSSGNIYVLSTEFQWIDLNVFSYFTYSSLSKLNNSGVVQWTNSITSSTNQKLTDASDIALDSNSNIYVLGNTNGTINGNALIGIKDTFIIKYNSSGIYQTTRKIVSAGIITSTNLAIDSADNLYVGGYTNSAIEGNTQTGTQDFFLKKYDSSETKVWTTQLGVSTKNTFTSGLSLDNIGNVYIGGWTSGGLDGNTLTGTNDFFLTKYTSAGVKVSTQQMGVATKTTVTQSIAIDSSNHVYVGGYTQGGLDGHALTGLYDLFIKKY